IYGSVSPADGARGIDRRRCGARIRERAAMNYLSYTQWNAFDWGLILILVASMVFAFRTGLVRAAFGLIGLIGGFQIATWCYAEVGDLVSPSRLGWPPPAR